jgi:hypothetical protein
MAMASARRHVDFLFSSLVNLGSGLSRSKNSQISSGDGPPESIIDPPAR